MVGRKLLIYLTQFLCSGYLLGNAPVQQLLNTAYVHLLLSMHPEGYEVMTALVNRTPCLPRPLLDSISPAYTSVPEFGPPYMVPDLEAELASLWAPRALAIMGGPEGGRKCRTWT